MQNMSHFKTLCPYLFHPDLLYDESISTPNQPESQYGKQASHKNKQRWYNKSQLEVRRTGEAKLPCHIRNHFVLPSSSSASLAASF